MKLLILKEKHENEHWLIESNDDLHLVALAIVRRRFEEGYWYGPDSSSGDDSDADEARRIVESEDGQAAWRLLRKRASHEYEDFDIRDLNSARGTVSAFSGELIFTRKEADAIRLAAEANAVMTSEQRAEMASSMDLKVPEVEQLLEANERKWEIIKSKL